MTRARVALIELVHAEDVPDYWIQLGQIDLRLGNIAGLRPSPTHMARPYQHEVKPP
jgi:hypothetical protein